MNQKNQNQSFVVVFFITELPHALSKGQCVAVLHQQHTSDQMMTASQFGLGFPLASGGELICTIPFPGGNYFLFYTCSTGLANVWGGRVKAPAIPRRPAEKGEIVTGVPSTLSSLKAGSPHSDIRQQLAFSAWACRANHALTL